MINGKKVIAVTLARGGSKGIPKKNMVDINGRPLIDYTVEQVQKSRYIDEYYISTDDEDISMYCYNENIFCIQRPKALSSDTAKSSYALMHAVNGLECDYVVEVMATNPLKNVDDIDGCIKEIDYKGVDSVVSVNRIYDQHPSRVKYLDENNVMQDFYPEIPESRRQDLTPAAYIRNGSIYVMKKSFLMDNKVRYDKNSVAYTMPDERTVNIDEWEDLEIARIRLS